MPLFRKILLLACLCYLQSAMGQYKLEQPVMIGKEQGLPTNEVRSIRKGKDGFIWMGSDEGLCRFDGQHTTIFKLTDNKVAASFDNVVNAVLPLDKEIWTGTDQGIAILDIKTETFRFYQLADTAKSDSVFRRFNQAVVVLFQDRQGEIWLGTRTRGLWMYDKKRDNFRKFFFPESAYQEMIPVLGSNRSILSIEASQSNDSIIWAGTPAGLQEINKYSGKVKWYTYPQQNKDYQVSLNAFRRLYHHDDGLLYVGSWSAGINVFDPHTKTFTPLPTKESEGNKLLQGPVSGIRRKSKEEFWITSINGLGIYNTLVKAITWYKFSQPLKKEFYGIDYIDEANRIWYRTIHGVQYFDPAVQQFTSSSFEHLFGKDWAYVFYIIPDASGTMITICPRVAEGLFIFNKPAGTWTKLPFNGLSAMGQERIEVRGFAEIGPGQYIISAEEGLYSYSVATKTLSVARRQPAVTFKRWGEIIKDDSGYLWLSADADGLIKWNPHNGQYRVYKKELIASDKEPGFGRPNNLFKDSRNNIWFSRSNGYSVHLSATDSIINFTHTQNESNSFPVVNNFTEDRNGKIWIVASDGWYGYADVNAPQKGMQQKFDLKAKNIRGEITNLATDKEGNAWTFTHKELIRINASDMSLSTFSFNYGVKAPDFYNFSFLPTGEMIFGNRNGITLANPAELKLNKELPVPYILQLQLSNQPVSHSLYSDGKLDLKYNQNFISLFFSAKAYTMANSVRFRYRLKEFDDWTIATNNRLANYTNVPPGNYVFQLQAANNEGIWNPSMLELSVHIDTPWWRTWLFRIAITLLVAALIYQLYRYRIAQVKKKEKLKTQYEKKLANVEMSALLAQMNPHFLFNSLNSIDSYIIKNESGKASEYLNNFARLMRLILQNSRSNYISLKDELEALDLYLQMERLRFKDKFLYEIKIADGLDTGSVVIPPMLIQPYVENAVWHGLMHKNNGQPGKVSITIGYDENNLVCIVQDNGIGRQKAEELKMQKTGSHKRSMGMQITQDRIEMINKLYNTNTSVMVIDLLDDEGNPAGTRVELVITV